MSDIQHELDFEALDTPQSVTRKMKSLGQQHSSFKGEVMLITDIDRAVRSISRAIENNDVDGVEHYMTDLIKTGYTSESGGYDLPIGFRKEIKRVYEALVAICGKRSAFASTKFPDSSWTDKLKENDRKARSK